MRKKAIGQIIVCSIFAVILTGVLLTSLILFRGYGQSLPISGKVSEFFQNDTLIHEAAEAAEKAFHSLPSPRFRLYGCVPVITFSNNDVNPGSIFSEGTVPSGYILGACTYSDVPDTIRIEWASGRVYVRPSDSVSGAAIYEYSGSVSPEDFSNLAASDVDESRALISSMSGRTLKIDEFKKGFSLTGLTGEYEKTLVVLVPSSKLAEIRIDAAAATVSVENLNIETVKLDCAAADISVAGCTIDSLKVNSASNNGVFSSSRIRIIDLDSATGSFRFELIDTPDRIDVDAMSGNYTFVLPKDASFSVNMDSLSASLSMPGFSSSLFGHNTIVGTGSSEFDFDLVSGSVVIEASGESEGASF